MVISFQPVESTVKLAVPGGKAPKPVKGYVVFTPVDVFVMVALVKRTVWTPVIVNEYGLGLYTEYV